MSLADRFQSLLSHVKKNPSQFAKSVGFKTPQTVREILKGNTKSISEAVRLKISSNYPEININWLISGEGEMLRKDLGANATPLGKPIMETKENHQRLIPFYDVETTGGYEGKVSASDEGELVGYIQPGGWFDEKETAAIRHVGDSMVEYPNGCILAVKKVYDRRLLVYGRNYVIETREYRITKRIQKGEDDNSLMLYSTNTDKYEDGRLIHEPFSIALEDIVNIYSVLGYIVNQMGDIRLIRAR